MQEGPFRIAILVFAALMVIAVTRLRFCYSVSLPAKIAQPEPQDVAMAEVSDSLESSPSIYAGYLEKDAEAFGISPAPSRAEMAAKLRHHVDETRHELDPRGKISSLDTAGLRLSIAVRRVDGTPMKMMVLAIENRTSTHLAYRVVTRPAGGARACHRKVTLIHNAMAIRAGARQERSECLYRRGWTLAIERVETLELPDLSYFYVSKVMPEVVGIDSRVGRGHQPPVGSPCQILLPATIRNARESGDLSWRDFVDFFARHRCETYRFPEGYRAFTGEGQSTLPARSSR